MVTPEHSTAKGARLVTLALLPALVSLGVTTLRLIGELQGWDATWFSNEQPDPSNPDAKPGLMGIAWLVPFVGLYFGARIARREQPSPHLGRTLLLLLLSAGLLFAGFYLLQQTGLMKMPSKAQPGTPDGLGYALVVLALSLAVMIAAWPRLSAALLVYALLARIPVVFVTWLALANGWDTHHVKLPAGSELPEGTDLFLFLTVPQLTFWPWFTVLTGGLFGCAGALLARRR